MRQLITRLGCLWLCLAPILIEASQWISAQRAGDIAYVLLDSPPEIRRYDLSTGQWLPALSLRDHPTSMLAETNALHIAFGTSVYRYAPDLTAETHLLNTGSPTTAILSWTNHVYLVHPAHPYAYITSLRRSDGTVVTEGKFSYVAFGGASVSSVLGRIYGRSPLDINTVVLNTDGTFGAVNDSPYHYDYSGGEPTFVLGDGRRVTDSSGIVYEGDTLRFANSFDGRIDAMDFYGGSTPIVLRDTNVIAFSQIYLPTGSAPAGVVAPKALFVRGTQITVFGINGSEITVCNLAVADLKAEEPEPGKPVDPRGLAYTPDTILRDRAGDLILYNRSQRSLFRWSVSNRGYAPTVPLVGAPAQVAYSAQFHRVFLGFASGKIDKLDLGGAAKQVPLINTGAAILGMTAADPCLFTCVAISPGVSHQTYDENGVLITSRPWSYFSSEFIWSAVNRRVYYFNNHNPPNDLHSAEIDLNGGLGTQSERPYHYIVQAVHPIRVSPDARAVLLGSGEFYEGTALTNAGSLPVQIVDAAWTGQNLYTIRVVAGVTVLQQWNTNNYSQAAYRQLSGAPLRVFAGADGVTVVTLQDSAPRFHLLDQSLTPVFSSPVRPSVPGSLTAVRVGADTVTLAWTDLSDNEDAYEVEQQLPDPVGWKRLTSLAAGTVRYEVTGLAFSSTNGFRVRAVNGSGDSAYAGPLVVVTLPDPRNPMPAIGPQIVEALATRVEIGWEDASSNEDGFRIERRDLGDTGSWKIAGTVPTDSTRFVDAGVGAGRRYEYRVVAFNAFSAAPPTASLTVTTLDLDTGPPSGKFTGLNVVDAAPWAVVLKWGATFQNETGFELERSDYPAGAWISVGATSRNVSQFTDTNAVPGVRYRYRVSAFNPFGRQRDSLTVDVTPRAVGGEFLGLSGRSGSVLCFAVANPFRIERYDAATRAWLAFIPLSERPTALHCQTDSLYVAYDRKVVRLDPGTLVETFMVNAPSSVVVLFAAGDLLYVVERGNGTLWLDRRTGALGGQGSLGFYSVFPGVDVAPDGKTLFGVTSGISPANILKIDLAPAGGIAASNGSPYHGAYSIGSWAAVLPGGRRVMTSSGIVYNTTDLTYAGSLAGAVDAVAFTTNGLPIVARGTKVIAYTASFLEAGEKTLGATPLLLAVDGADLLTAQPSATSLHGVDVQSMALDTILPPAAHEAPSLGGVAFKPANAFVAADGDTLVLVCRELSVLFRWSISRRRELPGIPLLGSPSWTAYSAGNNRVYTGYENGRILSVPLVDGATEVPFANLPGSTRGLACAGDWVFAVDTSGAWATHYVFNSEGTLISSRDWNYISRAYTWDPKDRKMYFFRDSRSPNDLHWEAIDADGKLGPAGQTPYHGEVKVEAPIRVTSDSSVVLIGSGQMFSIPSLNFASVLPYAITDGDWRDGTLYSVRDVSGLSQVQRWSANYAPLDVKQIEGRPLRLFPLKGSFLLLTMESAQPRMTLLDDSLAVTFQSAINHPPTDLRVEPGILGENAPAGTLVGRLLVTDPDAGDTARFSLNEPVTPASAFRIEGDQLLTTRPLDFELLSAWGVSVRALDRFGMSVTKSLTITLTNVNEAPIGIILSNPVIREEAPIGTLVGLLSANDPDRGDRQAFSFVENLENLFRIVGNRLEVAAALAFRTNASPLIRVQARDAGGLAVEASFSVTVIPTPVLTFSMRLVEEGADRILWSDVVQPKLDFNMRYEADSSTDLITWKPLLIPPQVISMGVQSQTVRYLLPEGGVQRYLRIRILAP
jgi:hypothetical protein